MKLIQASLLLFLPGLINCYNIKQVNALLQREKGSLISVINRDFRGLGNLLKGYDFSGLTLTGADFSPCKSSSSQPYGFVCKKNQVSDLTGANFTGCNLESVNFANAVLENANFTGANIKNANFANANLKGVTGLDQTVKVSTGAKSNQTILSSQLAVYCKAVMPNGSICSGSSWSSSAGNVLLCHCPQPSS